MLPPETIYYPLISRELLGHRARERANDSERPARWVTLLPWPSRCNTCDNPSASNSTVIWWLEWLSADAYIGLAVVYLGVFLIGWEDRAEKSPKNPDAGSL
jgi:hypothetical protein